MNQDLRDRFEARDAFGIVSSQVDNGALPLMCESVFESAQFALMLLHQARSAGRGVTRRSSAYAAWTRHQGWSSGVKGLRVSCFTPEPGETLVPFLMRATSALLDVSDSIVLSEAA